MASERKPIRISMIDGRNDNRGVNADGQYDQTRDWFYQNVRLKEALVAKGYDVNCVWGTVAEPERVVRLQNDILDSLAAIPGVVSVGYVSSMPMEGLPTNGDPITVEGRPLPPGDPGPVRRLHYLSPGLLAASGTRLVAGRDLTWTEVLQTLSRVRPAGGGGIPRAVINCRKWRTVTRP